MPMSRTFRFASTGWPVKPVSVMLVALGLGCAGAPPSQEPQAVGAARPAPTDSTVRKELVLVLIGSSTCPGATLPELREGIRLLRTGLTARARQSNQHPVLIGVALDTDRSRGAKWVETLGSFDEVLLGGGWVSTGALAYMWRDIPGEPSIPQVILFERTVTAAKGAWTVDMGELRGRWIGATEILRAPVAFRPEHGICTRCGPAEGHVL